jgi:hypothetical protein
MGTCCHWDFCSLEIYNRECSVQSVNELSPLPHIATHKCTALDPFIDSFAAYFQFPRSSTNPIDTIERILSIPILGTAFVAIRRKFERIK